MHSFDKYSGAKEADDFAETLLRHFLRTGRKRFQQFTRLREKLDWQIIQRTF